MTVAVSACLLGENCKYSGGNNLNQKVLDFIADKDVIPVCPEVAGGLPIPRPAAEIIDGAVMNNQGQSVDREFRLGAQRCLAQLEGKQVELVILQPRSPSCGKDRIYDGTFSGILTNGDGIFVQLLKAYGYPIISADEL